MLRINNNLIANYLFSMSVMLLYLIEVQNIIVNYI